MNALLIVGIVLAALAALLHIFIFVMESVLWTRPAIWKRFGLHSQDEAQTIKPMALNQGFYNLFLAIGVIIGISVFFVHVLALAGFALIVFACASMLAAAVVLLISNPKLARAALTQGVLPLLAVIAVVVGALTSTTSVGIAN